MCILRQDNYYINVQSIIPSEIAEGRALLTLDEVSGTLLVQILTKRIHP